VLGEESHYVNGLKHGEEKTVACHRPLIQSKANWVKGNEERIAKGLVAATGSYILIMKPKTDGNFLEC